MFATLADSYFRWRVRTRGIGGGGGRAGHFNMCEAYIHDKYNRQYTITTTTTTAAVAIIYDHEEVHPAHPCECPRVFVYV